ncbi:MAG: HesA/MoeB/ThiF family protein [Bacteroidales bacterium]|nr:HesA/MoeB/ThiF family protein [Bacteroidales bacterium]
MTPQNLTSEILSDKEIRRYTLQISIPELGLSGQEKIKQSKVLVIGAGGKGTSVLQNLAAVGIGKLGISDNYIVNENELSRQYLYGNSDLGKQKAIVSKQKLVDINHYVNYELHNVCLNKVNILKICNKYDILIDATDNFPAHYLINDAAVELGIPMIYGDVSDSAGIISVFNYNDGPSFRCLFPEAQNKNKTSKHLGFACQVTLMSIIGSIMANETLKVILDIENTLNGKLLKFDMINYSFRSSIIKKNPDNFK